jgi:hypothetical protein
MWTATGSERAFDVVDPMLASGCTGGVLVWHKDEATLARLDRRACKA